jgi:hypothetical protein
MSNFMPYSIGKSAGEAGSGLKIGIGLLVCTLAWVGVPVDAPRAEDANPFSNTRPDPQNEQLHQQLSAMDERMKQMESRVSAIQQVQVAVPAEALTQAGAKAGGAGASASAAADDESVELQTATFIACVNGKAMFRDSDQKPFFVGAKEASQNDAVRRLGGCKP